MTEIDELPRLRRELDELSGRMNARCDHVDTMLTECSAAINIMGGHRRQPAKQLAKPGGPADAQLVRGRRLGIETRRSSRRCRTQPTRCGRT
jgi:hypothetical protein